MWTILNIKLSKVHEHVHVTQEHVNALNAALRLRDYWITRRMPLTITAWKGLLPLFRRYEDSFCVSEKTGKACVLRFLTLFHSYHICMRVTTWGLTRALFTFVVQLYHNSRSRIHQVRVYGNESMCGVYMYVYGAGLVMPYKLYVNHGFSGYVRYTCCMLLLFKHHPAE